MTPERAQQILAKEISAPEKLIWSGPPRQGLIVSLREVLVGLFMALSGVLLFSGKSLEDLAADPWLTIWSGLTAHPVIGVVVAYGLVGHQLWNALRRRHTWYALTDLRAIFIQEHWPSSVKSEFLVDAIEITLLEGRDGRGTIIFGPSEWFSSPDYQINSPRFIQIEDARYVYRRFFGARSALRRMAGKAPSATEPRP